MAEPDDSGSPGSDEETESLDKLKTALESADNEGMDEGTPARFDIHWDPVTDAGGPPPADTESSESGPAFQFDLGGALARLGESAEPSAPESRAMPEQDEPVPSGSPVEPPVGEAAPVAPPPPADDPLSSVRGLIDESGEFQRPDSQTPAPGATPPTPVEPLPDILEATTAELPVRAKKATRGSVFADVEAETQAPRLPGRPEARAAVDTPRLPGAPPSARPAESPAGGSAAPAPPAPPALPDDTVPTLPDAPPAPSPVVTEISSAALPTADAHALRSAQLRADRRTRKSRLFGRSLLAILAVAAFIAVGLMFGRSYLFQTEWDAALTPIVDRIQQERGADFDHTIPLVVQNGDEYADTVLAATIGSDWADDLPIWRAAGLAAGNVTIESVAAELAEHFPVVYDPETDSIYQLADADAARVEDELRIVLEDIYELQLGGVVAARSASAEIQFTGVSNTSYLAQRAIDVFASGGRASVASGDDAAPTSAVSLPLPIQYEVDAIGLLGEAVLAGADVDPASAARGIAYPEAVATVLDDAPTRTAGGLLRPGEQALGEAIALGTDDWSLVWGAYLSPTIVDRLIDGVIADSFRAIERDGTTCFLGVFQTASAPEGTQVLAAMLGWVREAPVSSQAFATQLGAMRIQLEACDAGSSATGPIEVSAVDALITRQIDRLAR
jgi:hypothetical protein